MFERLLAALEVSDWQLVARLWTEFDEGLSAHLEAEESCIIPQLVPSHPREASAILQEHRHIRGRLVELGMRVDSHQVRVETARGFIEELRAHARHEEALLYRWADERLDAAERASVFGASTKTDCTALPLKKRVIA